MLLYKLVKAYIRTAIFLFYKKVTISGKENIPKKGPILFVVNHQNAMMDPLIVATATKHSMYFLARASAFKNSIAAKLLSLVHAIPIYRVRDKVNSKQKNEAIFKQCLSLFNKGDNILIFPEGSHSVKRQVRSLRAGFTRMTIDYLLANPDKELLIVPVGLNFDDTEHYAKSLHIVFGKPIYSRNFFDKNDLNKSKGNLIKEVHRRLTKLTVHIDDKNYEEQIKLLNEEDFLHPITTNQKLKAKDKQPRVKEKQPRKRNIFYYLMMLNSIFPFLIWKWLQPKIKEKEFISTAKFSLGITVFPLFYFIQTIIINHFFGFFTAIFYVFLSIILVFISTKTQ